MRELDYKPSVNHGATLWRAGDGAERRFDWNPVRRITGLPLATDDVVLFKPVCRLASRSFTFPRLPRWDGSELAAKWFFVNLRSELCGASGRNSA